MTQKTARYECLACGRTFQNLKAVQNARINGCPECKGRDLDLALTTEEKAILADSNI